jgi:hypothetical protein
MEHNSYRYEDDVDVQSLSVFTVQIPVPETTLRPRPGDRHKPLVHLNQNFRTTSAQKPLANIRRIHTRYDFHRWWIDCVTLISRSLTQFKKRALRLKQSWNNGPQHGTVGQLFKNLILGFLEFHFNLVPKL